MVTRRSVLLSGGATVAGGLAAVGAYVEFGSSPASSSSEGDGGCGPTTERPPETDMLTITAVEVSPGSAIVKYHIDDRYDLSTVAVVADGEDLRKHTILTSGDYEILFSRDDPMTVDVELRDEAGTVLDFARIHVACPDGQGD